jgi:negative regulator of genetic competence, sporulation and motility
LTIELIDKKTVRIFLSFDDMQQLCITYDQMDYKDPDTKRVILNLLQRVREQTSIDLSEGKLFIEAFPHSEGGCVLYVNVVNPQMPIPLSKPKRYKNNFNTPIIFEFGNIDNVINVCDKLFNQYSHLILKSSLYLLDQKYMLLIYTYFKMDDKIVALVSEYGQLVGKGAVKGSFIKEHAKPIVDNIAIETIVEYLC